MPASSDTSVASERFRVRLPAEPTALIGRDEDVARVEAALDQAALATILGPPGIGKTRVGLRVAHRAEGRGWFCDLSQARDRAGLCAAAAAGLGIPLAGDPVEAVGRRIAALGHAVIVLDNFDQLAAHAASLEPWLAAAPLARFVVTSRERLRLRAEHVVELAPLGDAAVALLVDRIRATRPDYAPDDAERASLAALAQALEGIPLALELAAARIDVLGIDGVLSRMPKQLEVLSRGARDAGARQATLRDAIAASWDLLDAAQRRALARCAVFRGGFGIDAAESVLGDGALDALQDLRDRSLLRASGDGRFSLYESVRAFAGEALDAAGDRQAAEAAHAQYYLRFGAEQARRERAQGGAIDALVAEHDNLLAVAERAIAAGARDEGIRAALALGPVLTARGPARFHLELLERIGALPGGDDPRLCHARGMAHDALGARAEAARDLRSALACKPDGDLGVLVCKDLGLVHHHLREIDEARARYEEALPAARAIGARRLEGMIVGNLGALEHDVGGFEQAGQRYHQALDLLREVGDARLEGIFLTNLGVLEHEQGRSASARHHYQRALELLEQAGDVRFEAITLGNLGVLEHAAGDLDEARARHQLAFDLLHEVGDVRSESLSAARLGAVLAAGGALAEAEQLFDHAERAVVGRDALALELARLHRCWLDLARGDDAAAYARVERAQAPRDGGPSLIEVNDDARMLLRMLGTRLRSPAGPRLEVGPEAAWFVAPGGTPQSLEKHAAVRHILDRLVSARLERPGAALSADELFAAGWPGVHISPQSANNRLYVALAKLRKMGLKLYILRTDAGYLLDPETPCLRSSAHAG